MRNFLDCSPSCLRKERNSNPHYGVSVDHGFQDRYNTILSSFHLSFRLLYQHIAIPPQVLVCINFIKETSPFCWLGIHVTNLLLGRRELNPHVTIYPFNCLSGRGDTSQLKKNSVPLRIVRYTRPTYFPCPYPFTSGVLSPRVPLAYRYLMLFESGVGFEPTCNLLITIGFADHAF